MDDKYIVFKRADWFGQDGFVPEEIQDAVVIRKQDIFATSALFAYAGAIRTSIEILEDTLKDNDPEYFSILAARLNHISDYFMSAGEEASKHPHRKVPD